jgi:hypothetical protein
VSEVGRSEGEGAEIRKEKSGKRKKAKDQRSEVGDRRTEDQKVRR